MILARRNFYSKLRRLVRGPVGISKFPLEQPRSMRQQKAWDRFAKNSYNIYQSSLAGSGERYQRYRDYELMEYTPELESTEFQDQRNKCRGDTWMRSPADKSGPPRHPGLPLVSRVMIQSCCSQSGITFTRTSKSPSTGLKTVACSRCFRFIVKDEIVAVLVYFLHSLIMGKKHDFTDWREGPIFRWTFVNENGEQ